jgi:pimeloyl-ACP methyl ester carboxylesterase
MSALVNSLSRFPLRHLDIGGRRQAYRCAGRGPALVLLHGISSGSGSWVGQLEPLAREFTLVAWDAPGYGQSAPLATATPSALDYAAALHELVVALELGRPLLLGHSLGAMIGAAYASRHPDGVRGLVLANPAQGYGRADAATREQVYRKRPDMLRKLGHQGLAAARGPVLLSQHAGQDQLDLVAHGMMGLTLDGFEAASYLLAHDDIRDYLADYPAPIGVIYGEEDVITPPAGVLALAAGHPGVGIEPLAGAGHASYIDQPDAFNRALCRLAGALPNRGVQA